ncbi:MAG: phenylalanine--tRNA ligase subunit beta [Spirochaetales bacterium]|nr:phenylalanine--tRNA ligase subunit beta [Spirochaetales bacterium]
MPKIEVNERQFFDLLGRVRDAASLEEVLPGAKAELDGWDLAGGKPGDSGASERVIKIELNDTNRPDLWSTAGLARQLRVLDGAPVPEYSFFSREGDERAAKYTVKVESSVAKVRPYMAAFVISGKPISDAMLRDAIQTQEKLCWNFGRKRRSVSMGLYRTALISWPVAYKAVDPDSVSFVPLGMDAPLTLRRALAAHPKGKEYGFILEGEPSHPLLVDATGKVLSYPPIINSNDLGAVQVGDSDLLVELTGTDLQAVTLSASIVACDFADAGYEIQPVAIEYPEPTAFGRRVVFPYYFQKPVALDSSRASKLLGKSLSPDAILEALAKAGVTADVHGQFIQAFPPEYRNDFLHAVDVVEDVMIGRGMADFPPERPRDFTIGRLHPNEKISRKAKNLMVGLGYQEMIYNYLGSGRDYVERMGVDPEGVVRISNPMTESVEYVRPSILPSLLGSEAASARAPYPHRIFETGKVAFRDSSENYGVATRQRLGFLAAHAEANYNEAASVVAALFYYLGEDWSIEESDDGRFIPGRQARLMRKGTSVGVFGELHPRVLENWGVTVPAVAGEIDIESFA